MDSLQHLNPSDICLIGMYLEIGDFNISDCFFNCLKKSYCNGDKFLFVRLTGPSRTLLPKCVKLLYPNSDASGSTVHGVPYA